MTPTAIEAGEGLTTNAVPTLLYISNIGVARGITVVTNTERPFAGEFRQIDYRLTKLEAFQKQAAGFAWGVNAVLIASCVLLAITLWCRLTAKARP